MSQKVVISMVQVSESTDTVPRQCLIRVSIGGPYGNFAGRDASRGMAKQSFDLGELTMPS